MKHVLAGFVSVTLFLAAARAPPEIPLWPKKAEAVETEAAKEKVRVSEGTEPLRGASPAQKTGTETQKNENAPISVVLDGSNVVQS